MEQSKEIVGRLEQIESKMHELSRGVAAVRYKTPGVGKIAIGVALGLFLYSVIGMIVMMLFWGIIAAAIAGGTAAASQRGGVTQTVTPLPRSR
ncbi:MAG: hypothetical protein ACREJD_05000 [Phycisphaerales bacterium]